MDLGSNVVAVHNFASKHIMPLSGWFLAYEIVDSYSLCYSRRICLFAILAILDTHLN